MGSSYDNYAQKQMQAGGEKKRYAGQFIVSKCHVNHLCDTAQGQGGN